MGANAQTAVPAFTAGQVLTAAQQTQINTGIPVFADTTARDAAFGGTGEKVLAEGQMAYIENIAGSSAVQYYDGAAWATLVTSGLTLIKTQTIGSGVSSVSVTDAFSATYDAYKIIVTGGVGSNTNNDNAQFTFSLGSSTTGYYSSLYYVGYAGATSTVTTNNGSGWGPIGLVIADSLSLNMEIQSPYLTKYTTFSCPLTRPNGGGVNIGIHQVATSYTSFNLAPQSGTLTGGTIRVYGYQNS